MTLQGFKNKPTELFRPSDHIGSVIVFDVLRVEEGIATRFGEATAIVADVTIGSGLQAGRDYPAAMIFQAGLKGALQDYVGSQVVAVLEQIPLKNGNFMYILGEPSDEAIVAAGKFFDHNE
jgi:hypothetical protein